MENNKNEPNVNSRERAFCSVTDGLYFPLEIGLPWKIEINHCFKSASPPKCPQKILNGSHHGEQRGGNEVSEFCKLARATPPENDGCVEKYECRLGRFSDFGDRSVEI